MIYGRESSFTKALDNIQSTNTTLHSYVVANWLPVKDMFAGYARSDLCHLDNHTNNKLER